MAALIKDVEVGSAASGVVQLSAFTSDPANGDSIVVGLSTQGAGVLAPTDNYNNVYQQIGTTQTNVGTLSIWLASNIVGGPSFKVSSGNMASNFVLVAWALTGLKPSPYNGDFTFTKASTNPAVTSGVSSPAPVANSIFLSFAEIQGNGLTDGSGWNSTGVNGFTVAMQGRTHGLFTVGMNSEYKIASSAQNGTFGGAGGFGWVCAVVSFAPAVPPTVLSASPNSGTTTPPHPTVTLTGTDFLSGATVTFDGVPATNVVVVNSTTITCTPPDHASPIAVDVVVTTSGGSGTLVAGYTYTYPSDLMAPPKVLRGHNAVSVTFYNPAGNFVQGVSVVTISGTGITIVSTTVVSPTAITIVINIAANATLGDRTVTVTT